MSAVSLFDSHAHLDADVFDPDRPAVLQRAADAKVTEQLIPAINADNWQAIADLCANTQGLFAAYGYHPMYLPAPNPLCISDLQTWLDAHPDTVAIGECGLDFYVEDFDKTQQQWFLDAQMRIARDRELPVILHARRAVDDVMATIRRFGPLRGIVHSYPGSLDQAKRLFDMGFLLGIGGPVTYKRALRLRSVVTQMPLEALVLETDAPDQPSATRRGQRNEPAFMADVANSVAELRGISPDEVATATTANMHRLLRI